MTNIKTFLTFLLLLMLACSSTAPIAVVSQPISTRAPPATPAPQLCQINTGVEAGTVNLRTCGGTYCPIATILHEGDTLTQTAPETVDGWTPVRSSGGLQGWVNSKYCKGK